jgi:hypothetical protein
LGSSLSVQSLSLSGKRLELTVADDAPQRHTIALVLPEEASGQPDGQGQRFGFYFAPGSHPLDPDTRRALLAAAALLDQAIPDAALVDCSGPARREGEHAPPTAGPGYPRTRAFTSASIQLAIVFVALLWGRWRIRERH